ncbi:hypothetical protein RJT34_17691 [Clitoria ternatea]|uniref:Uncharacterized protein n=1 Tax=Clitoria ternatea TaxID=43366 RepID=A0AAN9J9E6_CLITE
MTPLWRLARIHGRLGWKYAIVEELAQLGATVHTCSRNQTQLNESLHEWATKGYKVTGSICDAVSPLDREKLVATVSSEFNGKLNILEVGTCSVKGFSKVLAAA